MRDGRPYAARVLQGQEERIGPAETRLAKAALRGALAPLFAIALAGATLGRRRLPPKAVRLLAAPWNALVIPLRALHSGHVGDYVAWLTLGAGALAAGALALLR